MFQSLLSKFLILSLSSLFFSFSAFSNEKNSLDESYTQLFFQASLNPQHYGCKKDDHEQEDKENSLTS